MSELKIRRSTLEIVMLCLSFYEFTVCSTFAFPNHQICNSFIFAYLKVKKERKKPQCRYIYGGTTHIETHSYKKVLLNRQGAAFVYMLHILAIYVTIVAFMRCRGVETLVKLLIKTLLVFALVTDIPMVFINYDFSSPSESYLIGNKFAVSYLHCFIVALLFCINNEKN